MVVISTVCASHALGLTPQYLEFKLLGRGKEIKHQFSLFHTETCRQAIISTFTARHLKQCQLQTSGAACLSVLM